MKYRTEVFDLNKIPNVGPATIKYLHIVSVQNPFELVGQNPYTMFEELCKIANKRFDPCLLDVFISAVNYMEGAPAKMWWEYTEERKKYLNNNIAKI